MTSIQDIAAALHKLTTTAYTRGWNDHAAATARPGQLRHPRSGFPGWDILDNASERAGTDHGWGPDEDEHARQDTTP